MKMNQHISKVAVGVFIALGLPAMSYAKACPNPAKVVLMKAAKAIISGPEKNRLCIHKHQFSHVQKARFSYRSDGTLSAMSGKMSHELKFLPNDEVRYKVTFSADGTPDLKNLDLDIQYRGVGTIVRFAAPLAQAAILYLTGIPVPLAGADVVADKVVRTAQGQGWEKQAQLIVSYAAKYAALPREQLPAQLR